MLNYLCQSKAYEDVSSEAYLREREQIGNWGAIELMDLPRGYVQNLK